VIEAVRLVADWLADATNGVAAQLVDVPRFTGHVAPPALAAIYDSSRHSWVTRGIVPTDGTTASFPCLAVLPIKPMVAQPSVRDTETGTYHMPGEVVLGIHYLRKDASTAEAVQDWHYTARAIRGSMLLLARAAVNESRHANGVRLMALTKFVTQHGPASTQSDAVAGLVEVTWTTWETTPLS
jgi:hypothetical protein